MDNMNTYSKIILATSAINYLSSNLNHVLIGYQAAFENGNDMGNNIYSVLNDTLGELHKIAENIADFTNNIDAICEEDEIVMTPIFNILNNEFDEIG